MANSVEILIKARDDASKVMDRVERRTEKLGNSLKKMRVPLLALSAGLTAVGVSAINAASDLEEATNMSSEVFKENSDIIKAWADTNAIMYGVSKRAAFEYAGTLGGIIKASGFTTLESAKMSTQLMELAGDMASFKNIRVEDALLKIQSGLTGEIEPLKRVGVLLNENMVKQRAYKDGIAETGAVLTEAQKVQARFAEILAQTTDMQGDAIRTSDTFAGALREFRAASEDARAALGTALLPTAASALDIVRNLAIGFSQLPEPITASIAVLVAATAAVAGLGALVGPLTVGFGVLAAAIGAIGIVPLAAIATVTAGVVVMNKMVKDGRDEFEKLRMKAEAYGVEGARSIQNYNDLAEKVIEAELAHRDLLNTAMSVNEAMQEYNEIWTEVNVKAKIQVDSLAAALELAEEMNRVTAVDPNAGFETARHTAISDTDERKAMRKRNWENMQMMGKIMIDKGIDIRENEMMQKGIAQFAPGMIVQLQTDGEALGAGLAKNVDKGHASQTG